MARAAARGRNHGRSEKCAAHDHRREQLQRPIRALSAFRNELCRRWAHSQVRRRTVHATPHRQSRQGGAGERDHPLRATARNPGVRVSQKMTTIVEIDETRPALTIKDLKGHTDPDWCPGCGDFGVLHALKQAIVELGLYPHEVLTISGIGCSSNLPGYINTYGMHTLNGRPLAVATRSEER